MIKVEIKPSQVTVITRNGTSKSGQAFSINEQKAYIYLGGDYPQEFKLNLEQGQPPYSAGFYELHESSIFVGDYSKLRIGNIMLVPITDGKK